ncbi:MAG: TlpA family protein disulfide reductase [Pyrinomonadaceae bacterium]|nr:TlpA family protein disulfide reductase [Pyrinomonadaceae bacterium]
MKNILLFLKLLLTLSIFVVAQPQAIKVPLKIEIGKQLPSFPWGEALTFDKQKLVTKSPMGDVLKIERSSNNNDIFIITIAKDLDGKSLNDVMFEIGVNEKKTFTRRIYFRNGKSVLREFELISSRNTERKTDVFHFKSNFSAQGLFLFKGCKIPVGLFELIPDGDFTNDKLKGSNLGIDRNNDGKFYGKGEWLYSDMIIDFCSKNYLISQIAQDGSSLTLKQTNLQNVKLFQESPKFKFTFVDNKTLSSENLKGKPYLIDFWATWCGICIAKMPEIKQLEGTLPIIYFNTDTIQRKPDALKLIDKLNIAENSVLKISPNADNFYKSYQRFYGGLPFYVLIDGEGRFRYGGGGGENLQELKDKISELNKQE